MQEILKESYYQFRMKKLLWNKRKFKKFINGFYLTPPTRRLIQVLFTF